MRARIDHGTNTITPAVMIGLARELIAADRDIAETTTAAAAARGVRSGILKRVKSAGADMEAFADVLALQKMDDDDRQRRIENKFLYAEWLSVKLYREPTAERPQGSMFDNDPDALEAAAGLQDARDHADGYNSRRHGGLIADNPKDNGSRGFVQWDRGWRDADFELAGKPAGAVTASTKRRKVRLVEPGDIGEPAGTA